MQLLLRGRRKVVEAHERLDGVDLQGGNKVVGCRGGMEWGDVEERAWPWAVVDEHA